MIKRLLFLLITSLLLACSSIDNKRSRIVMIEKVIPTDNWELILELTDTTFLIVETNLMYDKGYDFLAYPNQLKAFSYDDQKIHWKNGKSISLKELKPFSGRASLKDLENKSLRISYKNQAPTKEHESHHWYGVYLYPFKNSINIGESIAGGHAERGGSVTLTVNELLEQNDWENHFRLSGCEWAIDIEVV